MFPDYDLRPPTDPEEEEEVKVSKVLAFIIALFWILFLICFGILVNMWPVPAKAHDAPSGMKYDPGCCTTIDCRPADGPEGPRHHKIQITEVTGGYRVTKPSGKFDEIEWNSAKVRESKDGEYHVCTYGGADETGTICIYVPQKGW